MDIQIGMPSQTIEMKPIPLELRADTLRNLDGVAGELGIPRVELIRRCVEVGVLLGGVSVSEITHLLQESLQENELMLSEDNIDKSKLGHELAKSAFLAAALCSISLVNEGREKSNVLKMYFRAMQTHSIALAEPELKLEELDVNAVRQDVVSFSNLLRKLELTAKEEQWNESTAAINRARPIASQGALRNVKPHQEETRHESIVSKGRLSRS
ncbi:MAG: hypothetical protein ACRDF4_01040 [Rhabdochlamydiaceae bacterium]